MAAFGATPPSSAAVPWLSGVVWGSKECGKLMSELISFKPPMNLQKVNILLVGEAGAGKSSFISSVDSIFKWRISRRAPHGQATSTFTQLLTRYTFRMNAQALTSKGIHDSPRELPFAIWDTPGWTMQNYCTGELGYILDGNVSSGSDVTQLSQSGRSDFRHFPALSDKMHVVLFVVPCEEGTNSEYMAKLRTMKAFCTSRGIPSLMLLTKIDEYDKAVLSDVTAVVQSRATHTVVLEAAKQGGMGGPKDVFPVKAFSHESEPISSVSILILRALKHALYAAEDYLEGSNPFDK